LLGQTPERGTPIATSQGKYEVSKHGGLYFFRRAWDVLDVDGILRDCGVQKLQGVPAEAVAFLQTATPLIGRGTIISGVEELHSDPLLRTFCGTEKAWEKDVSYRFLGKDRFDFESFSWRRVERLQGVKELRFSKKGLLTLDGSLARKTGNRFERIRPLYDHVTDSYPPAYDMLAMVYTDSRGEVPIAIGVRTLTDEQYHYLQLIKKSQQGFKHLVRYAASASIRTPIFIRPSDFSTARLKLANRNRLAWFGQISQKRPVELNGESTTPQRIFQSFAKKGRFVKHEEIGSEAASCIVKLPAYGPPVKLFAFREGPGKSIRAILSSDPELEELDFQEALYALRGDFGEDKLQQALAMYRRFIETGCPTRRTAFDSWFFVLDFCKELHDMEFRWFTQAKEDSRFTIRGQALSKKEIIDRYLPKVTRVRNLSGIKAFSVRAKWEGFGTVKLVIVREKNRKPYLLVTDDLNCPVKGVITSYKRRWRIECTFREEKQNLNLEGFRVRNLTGILAHLNFVFLTHTLLRVLAQIDEALMEMSVGGLKDEVINVLAVLNRRATKIGIEFLPNFELYYLIDVVKGSRKRRKVHPPGAG
jgi:hypothetical protein